MKECKTCNIKKEYIDFRKSNRHSDGYMSDCKECVAKKRRKYYLDDYDRYRKINKDYYELNKIEIIKAVDKYKKKESNRKYREKNIEKLKQNKKEYYEQNKEEILKSRKEYYEQNKDNILKSSDRKREIRRNSYRKRRYQYIWREILRKTISQLKLKKNQTTLELLGYDYNILKEHLENKFIDGMTWENHGEWHVDHIIPIAKFKDGTPPNIVNKLENLRPLWASENLSKQDTIDESKFKYLIDDFKDYLIG